MEADRGITQGYPQTLALSSFLHSSTLEATNHELTGKLVQTLLQGVVLTLTIFAAVQGR